MSDSLMASSNTGENMTFDPLQYEIPRGHVYRGLVLTWPVSHLQKVEQLQYEADDVIIASYPKTGATLTQEMVYLIRNDGDVRKANKDLVQDRVPYLEMYKRNDPDRLRKCFDQLERPRSFKTHLSFDIMENAVIKQATRVIYVMRNPKDTMVSLFHFYRMHAGLGNFPGTWSDFFEYAMSDMDAVTHGSMFDHVLGWWRHRDLPNLLFLKFENLVREPRQEIARIAEFCGVRDMASSTCDKIVEATRFITMKENPKTNYTGPNFALLKAEISPFMRKGQVGDWKNYFTPTQNERFDKVIKEKWRGSGLEFSYE